MAKKKKDAVPQAPLRLDLGCGKNKAPGFTGVDSRKFDGVDVVADLRKKWPWKADSVDEVNCSHMVEHLTWPERVHFFNELGRVLKKGAKAQITMPHWCSARYYGDPTHKEPFSEFAWFYLKKEWRDVNAPHVDYTCDFDVSYGYTLSPTLIGRAQEHVNFALGNYKEAAQDMVATAIKR